MFVIFCGILVGAGLISKRWVKESTDYILAGREISTFINMIGVCAIGFAGTTIALAPGFTIQFGLTASIAWGLIYAVCGLILFGVLFSKFIRCCGAQTLPEYLEMRYDGKVRSVVAITSVIGMSGILANNIVSCTNAIVGFTKWNPTLIMAVIFLIIIAFTFISGLWATTITDFFQVTLGVVIVPAVLLSLIGKFGGFDILNATWPGEIFEVGLSGASMNSMALTYPSVLNFIICFAAALVWGNNYYWMKIANCRSEKVAKKSFILAGIILVAIFCIPLSLIGGYAGAFHGEVFAAPFGSGAVPPTGAYGYVASLFPPLMGSLFVIGAVAASVSTSSTAALGASAVATRDIYQRLVAPGADTKKALKASKYIMVGIGILTWVLCLFPGGPTYLFAFANCWLVPPAILLGLGAIWPRFNSRGAIAGAVAGMGTMAVFTLLGDVFKVFMVNSYIYLATLGFVVTLVVAVLVSLTAKPKYYGAADWERVPNGKNRKDIKLNATDLQVLELLRLGHCYMSDLTDALGVDSKASGAAIEQLDQGGYLMRQGLRGSKFYAFEITEKGLAALPARNEKEAQMAREGLSPLYVALLDIVANHPERQAEFLQKHGIKSMHMASISSHLTRQGYIVEGGLFKRKLRITEKGIASAKKYL